METVCPLKLFMEVVGGKWKPGIICLLEDGKPKRFSQIQGYMKDITNTMLSQSLLPILYEMNRWGKAYISARQLRGSHRPALTVIPHRACSVLIECLYLKVKDAVAVDLLV